MTIKGKIETRILGGSNANNETFVTVYNFFNSLSSIGVTRIAYNRGNGGTGMTYWDQGSPPGNCAWALFRFGNAMIPFYVLLQGCNITQEYGYYYTNYAGCTPCVNSDADSNHRNGFYSHMAIAIAMRLDGTSPWNGTTVNTGTDTKGSPVWTPGGSSLAIWPRCNAVGGTQATNREAVTTITTSVNSTDFNYRYYSYAGGRIHMLADENNIYLAFDAGANASYSNFYFGKYIPRNGVNPQIPYVMLNNAAISTSATNRKAPFANNSHGAISNTTPNWYDGVGDGGVCHPNATLGVKIAWNEYPSIYYLSNRSSGAGYENWYHPNKVMAFNNRFNIFKSIVCLNEHPYFGILGEIDFFKIAYKLPTHSLINNKQYLVVGIDDNYEPNIKNLIPWDGITMPGSGISREGISF